MSHPSRRQFVAASLSGLPVVVGGTLVGITSRPVDASAQQSSPAADTVLEAIAADFHELRREGEQKPGQRRGVVRAAETLTGVLAAHLGQHYDVELKRQIRQQLRRKGLQALVQELSATINRPDITHDAIEKTLRRLERDGMRGLLLDVQKTITRMREHMPPDFAAVRHATQFDFCSDLRWFIDLAEMSAAIACALALGMAALNPGADAACAGATAALAMYFAMKIWYGC
jgi:hypothetical protein